MGKTKQVKEKKFDRNVEISAPILDPEIIRAIHSPPKERKLDIRHGGFKALLSDLNSQDSTDELTPITDNHVPSYVGISCAVSGYSNYSSYGNKKPLDSLVTTKTTKTTTKNISTLSRSQTSSPTGTRHVNHITIDKSTVNSADEERKELTEKLTASATEHRRSPSPLPPLEDDRHHGAYVGARYCPMPPPSKLVHKHIPLLGIDDDQDPDEVVPEDNNKVEQKIASLYGDNFVEDWRESMSHKSKKEIEHQQNEIKIKAVKSPKDLVNLKPTPKEPEQSKRENTPNLTDVATPNVKVLATVEKQFLNKLLTDENPPMPKSPSPQPIHSPKSSKPSNITPTSTSSVHKTETDAKSAGTIHESSKISPEPRSPSPPSPNLSSSSPSPVTVTREEIIDLDFQSNMTSTEPSAIAPISPLTPELLVQQPQHHIGENLIDTHEDEDERDDYHDQHSQSPVALQLMSPDSGKNESILNEGLVVSQTTDHGVEHIEYEIRAESPVGNQSSPVKIASGVGVANLQSVPEDERDCENLVSFSPEPMGSVNADLVAIAQDTESPSADTTAINQTVALKEPHGIVDLISDTHLSSSVKTEGVDDGSDTIIINNDDNNNGEYYLNLLDQEKSFIMGQVGLAESLLAERESEMDEDTVGKIRSAIGKANLLVNKKCNQFRELCERSIDGDENEQFAVLNDDLAGFWDMLGIQMNEVRKSFESFNLKP